MTDAILHLPERYLQQVETILRTHLPDAEVWAYGSRVNGDYYEESDLDLVVRFSQKRENSERFSRLADAKEAFTESNLPILVQLVDWDAIPRSFHDEISVRYVSVQKAQSTFKT